jgi:Type II site-specific deoxyribonuclease
LQTDLSGLTPSQLEWVANVIKQFKLPSDFQRNNESDWITEEIQNRLGDAMRIHHAFSRQALSKDRFEFAFERALSLGGISTALAKSRTNRGHDLTIKGVSVSLKTEAAAGIRADIIHVSKWMELGRGEWRLDLLRDIFLEHLANYERIFTLRCLRQGPQNYTYELVEIPKALMLDAADCRLVLKNESRQNPQPGYGYVEDGTGALKYALYFDGGSERKLQIKNLRKELCIVHATWTFESTPL